MNKPLEEAIEYAQKLAALLATLDDREDVLEGYEELDDEDHIAANDIAVSSNPASYDIVPACAGVRVADAKAAYPGYRFYRKKAEEKWRFLEPDEIVQDGDVGTWSKNATLPPVKSSTRWWKCRSSVGLKASEFQGSAYARRIDAEPVAEPELKAEWRWLEGHEVIQAGDMVTWKGWEKPTLPPDDRFSKAISSVGKRVSTLDLLAARRIDAEPAAEPEPKYRYDHHIGLADIGKEVQVRNTGEWKACGVLSEIGNDSRNAHERFYRIRNNSLKWRHCRIEESQ